MINKIKKQKGITLIALVITIIVLLILAGISILLVVGDNGVLKKSQEAVNKSELETAKEEIAMAWVSCKTEYLAQLAEGNNVEKTTYFSKEYMDRNLGNKGSVNNFEYGTGAEGETRLVYTNKEGKVYNLKISANGKVELGTGVAITGNRNEVISGKSQTVNLTAVLSDIEGEVSWSGPIGVSFSNNKGEETTVTIGSEVPVGSITITAQVGEYSANYIIKVVNQITVAKKNIPTNGRIGTNEIEISKNLEWC